MTEPEYVAINREAWTRANADTDARARDAWAQEEVTWGKWSHPESELRALPDVSGKEVVELGCGTGYFGAWLKRRGARRVVGVDVTPAQLDTARRNAPEDAVDHPYYDTVPAEWAKRWPDEELWHVRLRA